MAYTKKTWKDRISQYLNRRKITDINTGTTQTVTVVRDEGNVTEAGDTFTAAVMNDLETRIDNEFTALAASLPIFQVIAFEAFTSDQTITATSFTALKTTSNRYDFVNGKKYIYFGYVPCSWTNSSYQFEFAVKLTPSSGTEITYSSNTSNATSRSTVTDCVFIGSFTPSDDVLDATLSICAKVANSAKPITIPAYNNINMILIEADA